MCNQKRNDNTKMNTKAERGAVSSGHHLTSQAAKSVIMQGGNAFDGAIAAAFMACVCEPVLASPGGGGFAHIRTNSQHKLIDFFAQTPVIKRQQKPDFVEISADFGTVTQKFHIGNASSATPGFLPGLKYLYNNFAILPLETLLKPALCAARSGVEITPFQSYLASVVAPILTFSQKARDLFAPTGGLMVSGEKFYNRQMADFLETVVSNHFEAFPVEVVLADQKSGGHLTDRDFGEYQVVERESLCAGLGAAKIFLNPRPSAAGALIAETLKLHHRGGMRDLALGLKYMDELKSDRQARSYRGTTHISVIDAERNACALTLSNGEGNGYMAGNCGFMMNNMLGEADINPGGALGWPVNARMSSMMCPTIAEAGDGSVVVLGSGGSNRIRSALYQVLIHLLISEKGFSQAIDHPRLHVEDGRLDYETVADVTDKEMLAQLFHDSHEWPEKNMFFGGCHGVGLARDGSFSGAADGRRHGSCLIF